MSEYERTRPPIITEASKEAIQVGEGKSGGPSFEANGGIRESVLWFASEMEKKLKENDHKEGWDKTAYLHLVWRLREETSELERALWAEDYEAVIKESADVGNFAMMIADKARRRRIE